MTVILILVVAIVAALYIYSTVQTSRIQTRFPPIGEMVDVGGYALHAVHIEKPAGADLPPIVFIHGASGNLRDQLNAFAAPLAGRAEMLFVDRPGHGYSERGEGNETPDGQANAIATLMEKKGIGKAIVVGHSFGGAIAASFAFLHPGKTAGLVLLAPATHTWPGGVAWYYGVTKTPIIGNIFANLIAVPAGLSRILSGTACVFAPNPRPDNYIEQTGPQLALRPSTFRANAIDVSNLKAYVAEASKRYAEITAPTVIVTGDSDTVVLAEIHSRQLDADIPDSELIWVKNLGHKPDYIANDLSVAAIEKVAGMDRDLEALARSLEKDIAGDNEPCPA